MKRTVRRTTATRCMALLIGLHSKEGRRISRVELAGALRRSVRTVHAVLKDLESRGWIEVSGGGNGTAGLILVINDLSWKTADVADVSRKTSGVYPKTADDRPRIRSLEVLQGKITRFPSNPVENHHAAMWEQLDRFCAENQITIETGADMEEALRLMNQRKPAKSEVLTMVASAGGKS